METIHLNGNSLTIKEVISVARNDAKVEIDTSKLNKSRDFITKKVKENAVIYGVTTGFGSNADRFVDNQYSEKLQINLLRSHSCGIGENFSREIVRAIMLIRLNTLLKGNSGIQRQTAEQIQLYLNENIHPVIPSQGSVGASGDLCPLSHFGLAIIGEGYVEFEGKIFPTDELLKSRGISPIVLSYKEGLALNNGTTVMTALGVFAVFDFERLLKLSTLNSSLMLEALCARREAFDEKIHLARRNDAQIQVAEWIRGFIEGSTFIGIKSEDLKKYGLNDDEKRKFVEFEINQSQLNTDEKAEFEVLKDKKIIDEIAAKKKIPQDSYSIRCIPQVFGASLQALRHAESVIENEMNAAVDNPLIFADEEEVLSGGNFHGQPIALVLDYLKLAIHEIGNITERQIAKLVDRNTNHGLPSFLIKNTDGTNSGLMIPQYAAASLVSENKVLVHPASADSIPTCENTEDHVSMGPIAGRQALEILGNVKKITAIAILAAHHSAELRRHQFENRGISLQMAEATEKYFLKINEIIPDFNDNVFLEKDRFLYNDIQTILKNYEEFAALAENLIKKVKN
ncbi:MAG TPA: aromatic amino acid ammonia-lyase [Pyrinomonadaceae bacterium]|nr:aromatic amino acid ammonia-lyase [Pyrinomonadaceae bacterium]